MGELRIYWKQRKKVKWSGKRKDIDVRPGEYLPYIRRADGTHYGTYREYRFRYPCENYKKLMHGTRKKLNSMQVRTLSDYDREARNWWNKRHPDRKCH